MSRGFRIIEALFLIFSFPPIFLRALDSLLLSISIENIETKYLIRDLLPLLNLALLVLAVTVLWTLGRHSLPVKLLITLVLLAGIVFIALILQNVAQTVALIPDIL